MDALELVQWPAMAVTIFATALAASRSRRKRGIGFWGLLLGNVLWVIWGWHDHAYAVIAMQFALAALNVYGVANNQE